jgi:hypothetical protein
MDAPMDQAQMDWLTDKCAPRDGYVSLSAGTVLFHGYRSGPPVLNSSRAMWLAADMDEAMMYAQSGGASHSAGILTLALIDDIVLPRTQTCAARFIGTFDRDRLWTDRHDVYVRRLHEWGTARHLEGILEEHGSVVLFKPDLVLEVVDDKWLGDLTG